MLIVLLVLFGVGLIIGLLKGLVDSSFKQGAIGATWWITIVGIIMGIVLLCTNLTTMSDSQKLEAFYYSNVDVYRAAIEETEEALYIEVAELTETQLVSGENWKQSTNLSGRIKELRDAITSFNTELQLKRYWHRNPWTSWFVQVPSPEVKFLQLR